MTVLIDCDYTVYKACASCETEIDFGDDVIVVTSLFSEVMKVIQRDIKAVSNCLGVFDDVILFFSDSTNFRKEIDPAYKGHRNRKKPCGYRRAINALKDEYPVVVMPTLEADDALGIHASRYPDAIIASPDKDMRQIPGRLYDLTNPVIDITKAEGDRWHLIQTMAGDQTDGYAGIPGIGIKRAEALLDANGCCWQTVVDAFNEKGLDETVALTNARLAKILQADDYDFSLQCPRLWTPSPGSGVDNGAAVQDETDRECAA